MATDLLEKIGKVLIQAERAGTEEEAAVFLAKAQELSSTYGVELAQARAAATDKEKLEQATHKRIDIGEPRKPLNATFCELIMVIGRANGLKFNIAANSTYVIAFGFPSDIAVTEALYAQVSVQMVKFADEFIRGGSWRGEQMWDGRLVHARVARRQFYEGYTHRLGQRLRLAKKEAEAAAEAQRVQTHSSSTSTELAIRGKDLEVQDYYSKASTARGSWKGSRNTYTSNRGRSAGSSAAERTKIGGQKGLPGSRKGISA